MNDSAERSFLHAIATPLTVAKANLHIGLKQVEPLVSSAAVPEDLKDRLQKVMTALDKLQVLLEERREVVKSAAVNTPEQI